LKSQYRVDRKKVIPSAHLSDDLGADSLDKVEMIMALEDEFGVEIRDVDAERIVTVRDAIDYVAHALRRTVR
jgi:acyl carrier protein